MLLFYPWPSRTACIVISFPSRKFFLLLACSHLTSPIPVFPFRVQTASNYLLYPTDHLKHRSLNSVSEDQVRMLEPPELHKGIWANSHMSNRKDSLELEGKRLGVSHVASFFTECKLSLEVLFYYSEIGEMRMPWPNTD